MPSSACKKKRRTMKNWKGKKERRKNLWENKLHIYEVHFYYIEHAFVRLGSIFFFNDTATTEIYTLSLHDALPICEHRQTCHIGARRHGFDIQMTPLDHQH